MSTAPRYNRKATMSETKATPVLVYHARPRYNPLYHGQNLRIIRQNQPANALNTVGYKELFAYFDNTISLEEAIRQIQSNSRCYMRKQLTWFKKDTDITWFSPENIEDILNFIHQKTR